MHHRADEERLLGLVPRRIAPELLQHRARALGQEEPGLLEARRAPGSTDPAKASQSIAQSAPPRSRERALTSGCKLRPSPFARSRHGGNECVYFGACSLGSQAPGAGTAFGKKGRVGPWTPLTERAPWHSVMLSRSAASATLNTHCRSWRAPVARDVRAGSPTGCAQASSRGAFARFPRRPVFPGGWNADRWLRVGRPARAPCPHIQRPKASRPKWVRHATSCMGLRHRGLRPQA